LTIAWKEWDVGSEEEESDGSGGWIEVSSDEEHEIDISDSEDEKTEKQPSLPKVDASTSVLATSKVPPISHESANSDSHPRRSSKTRRTPSKSHCRRSNPQIFQKPRKVHFPHLNILTSRRKVDDEYIDPSTILGPRKKAKQDREERMQHAAEGREGREKFASKKATRREEGPHTSTTNREKARKKNLMMTIHKIRKVGGKAGLVGHGKKFRAMERKRQKGKVKK